MSIKIEYEQHFIEAYHFDIISLDLDIETVIDVSVTPLIPIDELDYPKDNSILETHLEFRLVFDKDNYMIGGKIHQVCHVIDRKILKEVAILVEPLFDVVKRLTYEVTEIAFDTSGVILKFKTD